MFHNFEKNHFHKNFLCHIGKSDKKSRNFFFVRLEHIILLGKKWVHFWVNWPHYTLILEFFLVDFNKSKWYRKISSADNTDQKRYGWYYSMIYRDLTWIWSIFWLLTYFFLPFYARAELADIYISLLCFVFWVLCTL